MILDIEVGFNGKVINQLDLFLEAKLPDPDRAERGGDDTVTINIKPQPSLACC